MSRDWELGAGIANLGTGIAKLSIPIAAASLFVLVGWRYTWANAPGETGHVRGVDLFRVSEGVIREKLSYVKG